MKIEKIKSSLELEGIPDNKLQDITERVNFMNGFFKNYGIPPYAQLITNTDEDNMKAKKITYQELLKESYPTYYVEWSILGSIITHKTEFHDSKSVKNYILKLEREYKNVTYTIKKTKKKNII